MPESPPIIYTLTDEAPALATHSLLPILRAFAAPAGVEIELEDISLSGRILAVFPERLEAAQQTPDALAALGRLVKEPQANVIKLPNISASIPQMKAAIAERAIKARYDTVKGSAVNPVLREGNSDRRAPRAVKAYARKNPHRMRTWAAGSKTHVATMGEGDFRSNERSVTLAKPTVARIEHVDASGHVKVLKSELPLEAGVGDASHAHRLGRETAAD